MYYCLIIWSTLFLRTMLVKVSFVTRRLYRGEILAKKLVSSDYNYFVVCVW